MYIHSQKKKTPLQQERRLKKRVNYFLLWKLNKMRAQIDEIFCIHAHTQVHKYSSSRPNILQGLLCLAAKEPKNIQVSNSSFGGGLFYNLNYTFTWHKRDLIRRAHAIERKIEIVLHTNCTIINALLPNAIHPSTATFAAAAFSRSCNCRPAAEYVNSRDTAKRPSIVGCLLLNYLRILGTHINIIISIINCTRVERVTMSFRW